LEEAERTKQLGYDRQREEEEDKAKRALMALKVEASMRVQPRGIDQKASVGVTTQSTTAPTIPRFGFGAIPGAATAGAAVAATSVSTTRFVVATPRETIRLTQRRQHLG
jgi:hypothetical protein